VGRFLACSFCGGSNPNPDHRVRGLFAAQTPIRCIDA